MAALTGPSFWPARRSAESPEIEGERCGKLSHGCIVQRDLIVRLATCTACHGALRWPHPAQEEPWR
jgi:hypothetical protein